MDRIRAGLVGTGFIGPQHVEAVRRLGNVEVVAVGGSSRARAEQAAANLHIPRAYGSYQELLADADVDVVHNCTPNHLHFEVNVAALAAGRHVISEKPLGMTSVETAELARLAADTGLLAAVNFNHRGYPMVQQARDMVHGGGLGEVRLLRGGYLQDWMLYSDDWSWRVDPALGGPSRVVADIGSHWMDLIEHVTGHRITSLFADLGTLVPHRRSPDGSVVEVVTEDYASVIFHTDQGARGSFTVSQVSPGHKNGLWIEIDGTESALRWHAEQPDYLWVGHRNEANQYMGRAPGIVSPRVERYVHLPAGHTEAWPDAVKNVMGAMYRAVAEARSQPLPEEMFATFADGHRSAVLVEAVLRSASAQSTVAVPRSHGRAG